MKTTPLFLTGVGLQELIVLFVLSILLFFAFRALLLWYWKVNVMVENQQQQISLLQDLLITMRKVADKKENPEQFVK